MPRSTPGPKPPEEYARYGLSGPSEVQTLIKNDVDKRTIARWRTSKPALFNAVLQGAAALKREKEQQNGK